jgi:hypothetical protein
MLSHDQKSAHPLLKISYPPIKSLPVSTGHFNPWSLRMEVFALIADKNAHVFLTDVERRAWLRRHCLSWKKVAPVDGILHPDDTLEIKGGPGVEEGAIGKIIPLPEVGIYNRLTGSASGV